MIKRAKRKIKLIRICPSQLENEIFSFFSKELIDAVIERPSGDLFSRPLQYRGYRPMVESIETPTPVLVCVDEVSDMTPEKWDWIMNRFMKGN